MPLYQYVGARLDGSIIRSQLAAADKPTARRSLDQQGIRLVSLSDESASTKQNQLRVARQVWKRIEQRLGRVPSRHLELLIEQLGVMLQTGMPLVQSLEHCEHSFASRGVQRVCRELRNRIESGNSFAEAVATSEAFPSVVRHLIAVGETSGKLPLVLSDAAGFMARRRETTSALLGALAYPTVVSVAAVGVAVYLVGWVIPKLAGMLESMGRKMPPMTQRLVDLSDWGRVWGTELGIASVAALLGVLWLYLRPETRPSFDRWLLRIPLLGNVLRMSEAQFLSNSLAIMLRSGVSLQDAIKTIASAHRNHYLGSIVAASVARLAHGESLTVALRGFDPLLNSLISIGERTGELVKALEHVAELYTRQLDLSLKRLSRIIEPAIIIVVGGAVGYVYAAFLMALMSTGANFQ